MKPLETCPPTPRCLGSRLLGWLALALLPLAAGCGPGVGGTGTGPTAGALDQFGAAPALLCSSELAGLLACGGAGTGGGITAPTAGTSVVYLADSTRGARTSLRIEGNRVELSAPCNQTSFVGEWGQTGSQAGRFFGNATTGTQVLLATLAVSPSGTGLLIELRDAQARLLLTPVLLLPTEQPALIRCD